MDGKEEKAEARKVKEKGCTFKPTGSYATSQSNINILKRIILCQTRIIKDV